MTNDTIAELLARDPFELTTTDIDTIVEYFQQRRRDFKMGGKPGPQIEKPRASLEDLGL